MPPFNEKVLLTASELTINIGTQTLLDQASLTIHEGERIGLVGRNGCGKSTFMKILTGVFAWFHPQVLSRWFLFPK